MNRRKIIVVGGGLAGLSATLRACEMGLHVSLFSSVPARRSNSVCAQGGINAVINRTGENDSPFQHFQDTIHGGDFLANQGPVKKMCEDAPRIIEMLDRMGVPFNRSPEGNLETRRFDEALYHRTLFAGHSTGQHLLYALDEQIRRLETEGLVQRYEFWNFLGLVLDGQRQARGITAIHQHRMTVETFKADSVIVCTGGIGMIFGKSTNSTTCTGTAASMVYRQGAYYANGEFIQVHPTCLPGKDKARLIPELFRAEGARLWTYKEGKPFYFLEEWFPQYKTLVPGDMTTRAIFRIIYEMGLGIDGKTEIFLDVSHLDEKMLVQKTGALLETIKKFSGTNPMKTPVRISPAMHYSMGGLWVNREHQTNIQGLFAAGECDYQYHGANRLGANSLLSCLYGGLQAGRSAALHSLGLEKGCETTDSGYYEESRMTENKIFEELIKNEGSENTYLLHQKLGQLMTENCTVIRHNEKLRMTDNHLLELLDKTNHIRLSDHGRWANQELLFARQLRDMILLARVICLGAFRRNESRGSHYKPEFPERQDSTWLKTTKARFQGFREDPDFSYEDVDTQYLNPMEKAYV